jgi:hypothetical protein
MDSEMSESRLRPNSSTRLTPSNRSCTSSVTVDSPVSGDGSSAPTIISASWCLVAVDGSAVPTVVPRRMTVMSSAMASTSSSL